MYSVHVLYWHTFLTNIIDMFLFLLPIWILTSWSIELCTCIIQMHKVLCNNIHNTSVCVTLLHIRSICIESMSVLVREKKKLLASECWTCKHVLNSNICKYALTDDYDGCKCSRCILKLLYNVSFIASSFHNDFF